MTPEKVDMSVVENNRVVIGQLGGNLGGKFFKVNGKETWPEFEEVKRKIQEDNNVQLCLNRSPRRIELRGYDILSQAIKTSPIDGTTRVVFNEGSDAEASAAIVNDMSGGVGIVTQEAVASALDGENRIFANPAKLSAVINEANAAELAKINKLISDLQKQADAIRSTIATNKKKADDYIASLRAPKQTMELSSGISVAISESDD